MADRKRSGVAGEGPFLQIGEVADRTGVTQRTLRFYEERGLLNPPSRMDGGFRLYSEHDVRRVEQIKQLQSLLGLSLAEIKEMVEAEDERSEIRATYRPDLELDERAQRLQNLMEITERQYAIIGPKVDALLEMKADLEAKLQRYHGTLDELKSAREGHGTEAVTPS